VGIIIQARTRSTRFPRKVIKPLYWGLNSLEIIIKRLKPTHLPIVVATPIDDDQIYEIAHGNDVKVHFGPEDDVLSRIIGAAEEYNISEIVRVCADNPFIDPFLLMTMVQYGKEAKCDYITYGDEQGQNLINLKLGLFGEYVKLWVLKGIHDQIKNAREHVTWFATNPFSGVKARLIPFTVKKMFKLSIDTEEDFNRCKRVFNDLGLNATWLEILEWVNEHT